jgi:hypothetical protein
LAFQDRLSFKKWGKSVSTEMPFKFTEKLLTIFCSSNWFSTDNGYIDPLYTLQHSRNTLISELGTFCNENLTNNNTTTTTTTNNNNNNNNFLGIYFDFLL